MTWQKYSLRRLIRVFNNKDTDLLTLNIAGYWAMEEKQMIEKLIMEREKRLKQHYRYCWEVCWTMVTLVVALMSLL